MKSPNSNSRPSEATPLPDIKPATQIASLDRKRLEGIDASFPLGRVAPIVGMSPSFIRKVCGSKQELSVQDVLCLLDQDCYKETFIPRSMTIDYLMESAHSKQSAHQIALPPDYSLIQGNALDIISQLPQNSVQTVVTSTPYWALRIYKDSQFVSWADGENCPFGHEQTPEGFVRHTLEILHGLYPLLTESGSVWWNIMDTFNTRTQIRGNAVEALRAMQGKDKKSWGDHECRRYSAGHSYLKDGEQCMIPSMIAERASRIGYYVKSVITWAKTSSLPEPQETRVSRNLEYVIHFAKIRGPVFNKDAYRQLPAALGGRNNGAETDKLSDVWTLPTSSGRDGHGAQFPIALPGRCIALGSNAGDYVLDPFVGSGNTGVAAKALGRRFIGIDVSEEYLALAKKRISSSELADTETMPIAPQSKQGTLL